MTTNSQLATWLTSANAPSRRFVSISSGSVGTSAAVSAPSPSSRLNKLGNVNAVTKAELSAPAPKTAVVSMSRPRPRTRDTRVAEATMPMCFRFLDTRAVFWSASDR